MNAGLRWASDRALLVSVGDEATDVVRERVHAAFEALRSGPIPGVHDLLPAYTSILLLVDPLSVDAEAIESFVRDRLADSAGRPAFDGRLVEIPVCYEQDLAPDLAEVARVHGLRVSELIDLHCSAAYVVSFLGFVAGFPYLAGLPAALATPRLAVPRRRVPAGSVAIGGSQAGIYPVPTPGGWRIVGRTPIRLFRPGEEPPTLLAPGDRVRFVPIDLDTFREEEQRS